MKVSFERSFKGISSSLVSGQETRWWWAGHKLVVSSWQQQRWWRRWLMYNQRYILRYRPQQQEVSRRNSWRWCYFVVCWNEFSVCLSLSFREEEEDCSVFDSLLFCWLSYWRRTLSNTMEGDSLRNHHGLQSSSSWSQWKEEMRGRENEKRETDDLPSTATIFPRMRPEVCSAHSSSLFTHLYSQSLVLQEQDKQWRQEQYLFFSLSWFSFLLSWFFSRSRVLFFWLSSPVSFFFLRQCFSFSQSLSLSSFLQSSLLAADWAFAIQLYAFTHTRNCALRKTSYCALLSLSVEWKERLAASDEVE